MLTRLRTVATLLIAAVLPLVGALRPASSGAACTVKIGVATDFTGGAALVGEGQRKGSMLAVEEINKRGGAGRCRLILAFADNKSLPAEGVNAVRKLADVDQVHVILGSAASGATLAVMPVIKEIGIPQLTETSTNPLIYDQSGPGRNEWQFRFNVDDRIMAQTFAKYIRDQGVRSIALMGIDNDYGRGAIGQYQLQFKGLSVNVTNIETFPFGAPDYRPLLSRIKRENPDAILMVILAPDAAVMIRQYHELGMRQRLFARGNVGSNEFLEAVKDNPRLADGIVEATLWTPGADPDLERLWEKRWGGKPTTHGAMAFYGIHILAEAVKIAAKDGQPTRRSIRDALTKVDMVIPAMGRVKFDDHHQAYTNMVIHEVRDGKIVLKAKIQTGPPSP
ncbi:MAG: ABC transporter substrate-binding protein [Armatimonadota bacterium]|nr:ABC transporter substrate-binding protein [Armatimonadota bacterium]